MVGCERLQTIGLHTIRNPLLLKPASGVTMRVLCAFLRLRRASRAEGGGSTLSCVGSRDMLNMSSMDISSGCTRVGLSAGPTCPAHCGKLLGSSEKRTRLRQLQAIPNI